MIDLFTDRSRIESYQRCHRKRFLEYHEGPTGMGITSARKPLPLAVGGSVHVGRAVLLERGQAQWSRGSEWDEGRWRDIEDAAVKAALDDFATFDAGRLELDTTETDAMDLSAFDDVEKVRVRSAIDEYLYNEQAALVEAMVRAYARRRLRPFLEQYEVLEVEREGKWLLSTLTRPSPDNFYSDDDGEVKFPDEKVADLWFMSRPDALIRDRQSNDLYISSLKTAANWDTRKERDVQHDMQGLSEGVEIEKRLQDWWERAKRSSQWTGESLMPLRMFEYLGGLPAPPRILGIVYEFMFKGERWSDKDLTARLGVEARTQRSHLVRGYLNAGMASGDEQWNWAWDYVKDTGEPSKLYWKTWRGTAVWNHMPIAKWIDMLDATVETVGEEGVSKGWSGPAQASGFTTEHPLDAVFHPPIIVYRNDDELRDWVEQVEAQERGVAEHVALVHAATNEGERRSLLNQYFPQSRHACVYPTVCQFCDTPYRAGVCYAGEHIQREPLASGDYVVRVPNHPVESNGK